MRACALRGVVFGYVPATPVLYDCSAEFGEGWHGLVGGNGDGKSTLLRLLAGELQPDRGVVQRPDPRAAVPAVLCAQTVDDLTPAIEAFAASWDGPDWRLRGRLALDVDTVAVQRWATLSPGERKRWQVGAALWATPDVLLLDEPTNHLDRRGRDLLLAALRAFRGIGVVVSHDRAFLDALTDSTTRLRGGRAEQIAAPCSAALEEWARADVVLHRTDARLRAEERRLTRLADAARRAASDAEAAGRKERRLGLSTDARTMGRKNAIASAAASHARRVRTSDARRDQVTRTRQDLGARRHRSAGEVVLDAAAGGPPPGTVLADHHGPLTAPDGRVLVRDCVVMVHAGARVHVAGANGAGKSTLIGRLLAAMPPRIRSASAILPQQMDAAARQAEVMALTELPADERGTLLSIGARLGLDPARVLEGMTASPGEARKLRLARLLTQAPVVLVVDEPTNHLDLPAIEALQGALAGYAGTLLLITHDDALAAATTAERWQLDPERVRVDRRAG